MFFSLWLFYSVVHDLNSVQVHISFLKINLFKRLLYHMFSTPTCAHFTSALQWTRPLHYKEPHTHVLGKQKPLNPTEDERNLLCFSKQEFYDIQGHCLFNHVVLRVTLSLNSISLDIYLSIRSSGGQQYNLVVYIRIRGKCFIIFAVTT